MLLAGRFSVLYDIAELMRPALLKQGVFVTKPRASDGPAPANEAEEGPVERVTPAKGQLLSDYIAACSIVLDEANVQWALSLPSLPGVTAPVTADEGKGQLTSETDDDAADAGEPNVDEESEVPASLATAARSAGQRQRDQLRRFCTGALERAHGWPNLMRAYVGRLVLNGVAADLWEPDKSGDILSRLVDVLSAPGDDPTPEEQEAISIRLALAVMLLRQDVRRLSISDESTLRFKRAADRSRDHLANLDQARLEPLAAEIDHVLLDPTGEAAFNLAMEIASPPDGIEAAVAMLADEDEITAHEESGVLVIDDELPPLAERQLLHCAGMVRGCETVVVRGETSTGQAVLCVWKAPNLVIARRGPKGLLGKHYRLSNSNPKTVALSWQGVDVRSNLPRPVAEWWPGRAMPEDVEKLLGGRL